MSMMPEWMKVFEEVDEEELHKLALSGKDFENRIPMLLAEIMLPIMLGTMPIQVIMASLASITELAYYMGYQRGKKERNLTFVVRGECETQT